MELVEFIQYGYANSPRIRQIMDGVGVAPGSVTCEADLDGIPVTSKESLISGQAADLPFGGWLGVNPDALARIYASPGPIYDPEGQDQDFWRWVPALKAAGFTAAERVINTFSYHLTPAGFMFDSGLRALGCTVIPAGTGNKELQLTMIQQIEVSGFVGLPSYLMALIKDAEDQGLNFADSHNIDKALVTAEPLPGSLRHELEQRGIDTYQSYGTADLGCVAYECSAHSGMHINEGLILEVVDPNSGHKVALGEPGEIVVTLLNTTYPLLRFGTGDMGILTDDACTCGRGGKRIKEIIGRVGDAVKVRGLFVHPSQLDRALNEITDVDYYQALVTREDYKDKLILRIETRGTVPKSTMAAFIANKLRERLRLGVEVDLVTKDTINRQEPRFKDTRFWD
ncbi:AMP-binding protein [Metallumcola ferriviriculae]|uniref:AMP-binding protein n=1 Tax=Metallumcola ferriviriculae TaxID=3039180 RepID=A0AAU0URZ2_9FIRM|nr:AMP-binding protein [Desulfitibacteraceae bacterium MK1]